MPLLALCDECGILHALSACLHNDSCRPMRAIMRRTFRCNSDAFEWAMSSSRIRWRHEPSWCRACTRSMPSRRASECCRTYDGCSRRTPWARTCSFSVRLARRDGGSPCGSASSLDARSRASPSPTTPPRPISSNAVRCAPAASCTSTRRRCVPPSKVECYCSTASSEPSATCCRLSTTCSRTASCRCRTAACC